AALSARESSLGQAKQKDGAARQELDRLARELAELEATLQALHALRQRGQQTYSLVPFKGKRGVSRRPIYVECNAAGLIFHPDRETMTGFQLNPADIRQAVEARLKKLPPAPAGDPESTPYVLMLVRPDGITNYYLAQAALQGCEFGYELIDPEWVLDFSDESGGNPWRMAQSGSQSNPPAPGQPAVVGKIGDRPIRPYRR